MKRNHLSRLKARNIMRVLFRMILAGSAALVLALGLPYLIADFSTRSQIYSVEAVPPSRVAIVFGAGLLRNGTPSAVLRDRIETAARLYWEGKVEKLLMSGDNRFVDYNEPASMRDYAIGLGVPEEDIVLDFAGRRTYDTCYRARYIFGVEEAVLVTQRFHITRALYLCNNLGLDANGVSADVRSYRQRSYMFWYMREIPAIAVSLWEVWVTRPLPVLGQPEPIFTDRPAGKNIATP